MRIVHLFWGLRMGGAESMIADVAIQQAQEHDVFVVVGNNDIDEVMADQLKSKVELIAVNRPIASRNPLHLMRFVRQIRALRPSIVHAHESTLGSLVSFCGAPAVLTQHSPRVEHIGELGRFKMVYAISEAVQRCIQQAAPNIRSRVVMNGVRFDSICQKRDYGQRPFRIVQIGRLVAETKGQDILIEALSRLVLSGSEPAIEITFIGEGPSRHDLEALATKLGVRQMCHFRGLLSRAELYTEICSFDLLVQPSRLEGFGLTIVEAMAAAVPVLVSDCDGPVEIIRKNELGRSFISGDVEGCAHAIQVEYDRSSSPKLKSEMTSVRAAARELYDLGRTTQIYLQEYGRVLNER